MDYHQKSSSDDINYRKSGFFLAGTIVLVYALLLFQDKSKLVVLIAATLTAVGAWFEAWFVRKLVDLLIRIGNFMHSFTNPFIFGLIYVVAVLPTAFVLKVLNKDVLNLKLDSKSSTYWKARLHGKAWNDSFRNQF